MAITANSEILWVELGGRAVKVKRKQSSCRTEQRNNHCTASVAAEGSMKKKNNIIEVI